MASVTHPDELLGFELFELLPDAIIVVDRRGVIRYANRQAGQLFGQEARTLLSAPVEALLPEHLRERHIAHRAKYNSEPRMRPMGTGLDLVARRADGATFPVDIMLNPLKHLAEPMVLAVVRDMTDRRAVEDKRQLLMRELNHRAKNILSVVQAIAHQTEASSYQEFIARFDERIQSLSASHNLLVKSEWRRRSACRTCARAARPLRRSSGWPHCGARPRFKDHCGGGPGHWHCAPRACYQCGQIRCPFHRQRLRRDRVGLGRGWRWRAALHNGMERKWWSDRRAADEARIWLERALSDDAYVTWSGCYAWLRAHWGSLAP
jgi:PAS domain S-box-containing protein